MSVPAGRGEIEAFARRVGAAAAELLPDHSSIIWKGSTHKPWEGPYDFLPGLSDIDIHVYRDRPLTDPWDLRRAVVQQAGPAPYATPVQLLVMEVSALPDWWTILPGTYEVLAGGAPPMTVPETSRLLDKDRYSLAGSATDAARVSYDILGLADEELWPYLRSMRSLFPPVLYRAASVWTGRPERVWSLNRTRLVSFTADHLSLQKLTEAAVAYFEAALAACHEPGNAAASERALRVGQDLLYAAGEWAAARPDAVVDRRTAEPPL